MSSREDILGRLWDVRSRKAEVGRQRSEVGRPGPNIQHQTSDLQLPAFNSEYLGEPVAKFKELIDLLHGEAIEVSGIEEIEAYVATHYREKRVLFSTSLPGLNNSQEWITADPHSLEDVEFALFEGRLGVAENGAVWFTEELLSQRVTPFINQQLGIVIKKDSIVPTMAQAYEKLGDPNSGYGVFIAGPSKTADIEQSLVTGAHGARGLVVFLI